MNSLKTISASKEYLKPLLFKNLNIINYINFLNNQTYKHNDKPARNIIEFLNQFEIIIRCLRGKQSSLKTNLSEEENGENTSLCNEKTNTLATLEYNKDLNNVSQNDTTEEEENDENISQNDTTEEIDDDLEFFDAFEYPIEDKITNNSKTQNEFLRPNVDIIYRLLIDKAIQFSRQKIKNDLQNAKISEKIIEYTYECSKRIIMYFLSTLNPDKPIDTNVENDENNNIIDFNEFDDVFDVFKKEFLEKCFDLELKINSEINELIKHLQFDELYELSIKIYKFINNIITKYIYDNKDKYLIFIGELHNPKINILNSTIKIAAMVDEVNNILKNAIDNSEDAALIANLGEDIYRTGLISSFIGTLILKMTNTTISVTASESVNAIQQTAYGMFEGYSIGTILSNTIDTSNFNIAKFIKDDGAKFFANCRKLYTQHKDFDKMIQKTTDFVNTAKKNTNELKLTTDSLSRLIFLSLSYSSKNDELTTHFINDTRLWNYDDEYKKWTLNENYIEFINKYTDVKDKTEKMICNLRCLKYSLPDSISNNEGLIGNDVNYFDYFNLCEKEIIVLMNYSIEKTVAYKDELKNLINLQTDLLIAINDYFPLCKVIKKKIKILKEDPNNHFDCQDKENFYNLVCKSLKYEFSELPTDNVEYKNFRENRDNIKEQIDRIDNPVKKNVKYISCYSVIQRIMRQYIDEQETSSNEELFAKNFDINGIPVKKSNDRFLDSLIVYSNDLRMKLCVELINLYYNDKDYQVYKNTYGESIITDYQVYKNTYKINNLLYSTSEFAWNASLYFAKLRDTAMIMLQDSNEHSGKENNNYVNVNYTTDFLGLGGLKTKKKNHRKKYTLKKNNRMKSHRKKIYKTIKPYRKTNKK